MNRFKTLMTIVLLAVMAVACDKNDMSQPAPVQLEVNAHNISGKWVLMEWNGAAMAPGTYVYLDIVRNDRTYTMYQNVDSFNDVPHTVTGSYVIYTDDELGSLIRGSYDYDGGEWAHRYIVKSLTDRQMIWVAKDDASFTQLFERVDDIPVAD